MFEPEIQILSTCLFGRLGEREGAVEISPQMRPLGSNRFYAHPPALDFSIWDQPLEKHHATLFDRAYDVLDQAHNVDLRSQTCAL